MESSARRVVRSQITTGGASAWPASWAMILSTPSRSAVDRDGVADLVDRGASLDQRGQAAVGLGDGGIRDDEQPPHLVRWHAERVGGVDAVGGRHAAALVDEPDPLTGVALPQAAGQAA